jgi:hypothetical protein
MMSDQSRVCVRCKKKKNIRFFYSHKSSENNTCKQCIRQASAKYRNRSRRHISGVVYFLLALEANRVKIGVTNLRDGGKRFLAMQGASPIALVLVGTIESTDVVKLESQLHVVFREYWSHGEWFEYSKDIQNYIAMNAVKRDERWEVINNAIAHYNRECEEQDFYE